MSDQTPGAYIYGEDCPVGKVQVQFVGVSPTLKQGAYGYKPCDHAFIDVYVDGKRYNIQIGDYESASGPRRGLRIVTDCFHITLDNHSINAVDIFPTK